MAITKCVLCPEVEGIPIRAVVLYTGQLYRNLFLSIFTDGISCTTGSGEYKSPGIN